MACKQDSFYLYNVHVDVGEHVILSLACLNDTNLLRRENAWEEVSCE